MLYIGVMCRRRVSVSYIGIMHRLSLVVRWSFALGRPSLSAVSHWWSAVSHWLSDVRRWSSVLRSPLVIVGGPLLVVGCQLSLVTIPHRRRWLLAQGPALHGQGGVGALPSVRPPEKKKK